jgi:hypothetical protein
VLGISGVVAVTRAALDDKKDFEEKAVDVAVSLLSSGGQAFAASNVIETLSGGGTIMAIPIVVDVVRTAYLLCRSRITREQALEIAVDKATSLAGGYAVSSSATALAASCGVSSATVLGTIGIAAAGSMGFAVGAFAAMKILRWYRAQQQKEKERKILEEKKKEVQKIERDLDIANTTTEEQFNRVRRNILKHLHTDRAGGDHNKFVEASNKFCRLYELKIELGMWQDIQASNKPSWSAYINSILMNIVKIINEGGDVSVDLISQAQALMSFESFTQVVKYAPTYEDMNEQKLAEASPKPERAETKPKPRA